MRIHYLPLAQREHIVGEFVYRMFDPTGALLYIGTCSDITGRLKGHEEASPFFDPETTVTDLAEYDTRAERQAAEVEAIRTEFPRWNIIHRAPNHPDGHARTWFEVADLHPGTFRHQVLHWDYDTRRSAA